MLHLNILAQHYYFISLLLLTEYKGWLNLHTSPLCPIEGMLQFGNSEMCLKIFLIKDFIKISDCISSFDKYLYEDEVINLLLSQQKLQIDYWKPGKLHSWKIQDHKKESGFDEDAGVIVSTIWWTDK